MTSAPILRSSALQKALALVPLGKRMPIVGPFAATLAGLQASAQPQPMPSTSRSATARQWSTASHRSAGATLRTVSLASAASATAGVGDVPFKDLITAAARKYGVDPALLAGVVKQESNFNPNAHSGAGAKGLTQLMDSTARGMGVSNSFDPVQSLDGGARFLGGMLRQFHGDESLALAAYNAGPAAVKKYGGIPPYEQTQRYVPKVLGYATQFRRRWAESSPTPATAIQTD